MFELLQKTTAGDDENAEPNEDEQDDQNQTHQRNKFLLEKIFDDEDSCLQFIADKGCWSLKEEIHKNFGVKTVYRCNLVKYRGGYCQAAIYTMYNPATVDQSYRLFRRICEHTHVDATNKTNKISPDVKAIIVKYIDTGMTLTKILDQLRDTKDIKQPTIAQVQSVIKSHCMQKYGGARVTLDDMVEFYEANKNISDDEDEPFVLAYEDSSMQKDDEAGSSENCEWIRIFVTTKRLLKNSMHSKIVHADATYKITVEKFPVIVFGTTDQDTIQHFHLIGIVVSKFEKTADFEFGFNSIKKGIAEIANENFKPTALMCDAAPAISNAFNKVFKEYATTTLMCFAHVKAAVDRKAYNKSEHKTQIKHDLSSLKLSYNKEVFDVGKNGKKTSRNSFNTSKIIG